MAKEELWPELKWQDWRASANTVHLFTQIIGKVRLALMPMQAEWAQVPFTVTSRGLASNSMPSGSGSIDIGFDFIDHAAYFHSSNGRKISFLLKGLSVADFYSETFKALNDLDVKVKINPMSVEVPKPVSMDQDKEDKTYDEKKVNQWWQLLLSVSLVLDKYRSGYWGKQTQVSFFWGTFDLAVVRFSGKAVSPPEGSDVIHKVAMDAEQASAGFWPGDDTSPEPVFFAYTYPKPEGIENATLSVKDGGWSEAKGEFILPYEAVRKNTDPADTLLTFFNECYSAGAELANWDTENLDFKFQKPGNK